MMSRIVKISIIVVCKNSINTIKNSLNSVINQTYQDFELIVVDGNSSDGTKEFLSSKKKYISKLISENDTGISEAFNKAIRIAQGEWLYFLNADDLLFSTTTLEEIHNLLDQNSNFIIGKVEVINNKKKIIGDFGGQLLNLKKMKYYNVIPHQSSFLKKILFKNENFYDESLKYSMDYDFYWKNQKKLNIKLINQKISIVKKEGASDKNYFSLFKEYSIIQQRYKVINLFINKLNLLYRVTKFYLRKLFLA